MATGNPRPYASLQVQKRIFLGLKQKTSLWSNLYNILSHNLTSGREMCKLSKKLCSALWIRIILQKIKNNFSDRMRYPPDEWRILPEDGFATHVIENAEQALTADVLLQVGRSAKLEGCFKIQLGGSEILHADFPAKGSDCLRI